MNRLEYFWSNLERQYQEDKTRLADKKLLLGRLHWLEIFPVNEMAKLGWIEKHKDKTEQLNSILHFLAWHPRNYRKEYGFVI